MKPKLLGILIYCSTADDCLLNYSGKVSVTTSGRKCQRWDKEYPHVPKYTPKDRHHNHCRNPDDDPKGPWCYTTDPDKRYEYCTITDCNDGTPSTCWSPDQAYKGKVSRTRKGVECQRWDKNKPHRPKHRPRKPKAAKNYCRNPDNDPDGPWCYTTDPNKRYDYCDIPRCEDFVESSESVYSADYSSYYDASESDDGWIVYEDDGDDSWRELLAALLLGGEGSFHDYGTMDYEAYDYNNTDFEEYRVDFNENLFCQTLTLPEPGSDYTGTVSVTVSGRKCQNWHDQTPHKHDYAEHGNHNYCRNHGFDANDAPSGVWCYTTDPDVRWEFCSQIPVCSSDDDDDNDKVDETCGKPVADVVWGFGARRAGLPSRLGSKGQLLSQRPRSRNRRSKNQSSREKMTWMEMLKQYKDNPHPQLRIMGGEAAESKTWPWQVAFRLKHGGKQFCGGTIVSSKFVLSAAHCFTSVTQRDIFVSAGHINKMLKRASKEEGFQHHLVDRIISHESYDDNVVYADIALVKVTGKGWKWSDYVKPACLPENGFNAEEGAVCAVVGWGVTDADKHDLNQATIPIVNFKRCQKLLDNGVKDHSQFCAGVLDRGGVDTCQGDSGGPLVCVSGGVWKVVGITSWGFGCGEPDSPGVYTNVAKYRQWINYWIAQYKN